MTTASCSRFSIVTVSVAMEPVLDTFKPSNFIVCDTEVKTDSDSDVLVDPVKSMEKVPPTITP